MTTEERTNTEKIVINAEGAAMGRIAAYAAKQSLLGKKIIIVNSEKAIVTGRKDTTLNEHLVSRQRGGNLINGPFYPSAPEKIMKRTIRGMLPYKQERGRSAFKRIKTYEGLPEEFKNDKMIKLEEKKGMILGDLAGLLKGRSK